jgi:hypothetical protein
MSGYRQRLARLPAGQLEQSWAGTQCLGRFLQRTIALRTGLPLLWVIAGQNAASSLGRMLSPTIGC